MRRLGADPVAKPGWLEARGAPATAVTVEPTTAPADAFNRGEGLRWLEPGEVWEPAGASGTGRTSRAKAPSYPR
ncbi:hypothetical protein [Arthrobacter ramosus]|uniref:hypothetical protein n=1 Tax=Arthrobacter ramosus TaxID=1672 RepID=UPI0031D41A4E